MSNLYKILAFTNSDVFEIKITELPIEKETEKQIWIKKGYDDRRILKKNIGEIVEINNNFEEVSFKTFAKNKSDAVTLNGEIYNVLKDTVENNLNSVENLLNNIEARSE